MIHFYTLKIGVTEKRFPSPTYDTFIYFCFLFNVLFLCKIWCYQKIINIKVVFNMKKILMNLSVFDNLKIHEIMPLFFP